MSSFNVLKSNWISSKEIRSVSLDSVPITGDREKNAVFQKKWDHLGPTSEPESKDDQNEKQKAITIIEEAYAKAQLIEKEAYEKAFSQGHKEGLDVAERKMRSALQSLQKANEEFKKLKKEIAIRSERELISLCLAVSKKLLVLETVQNKDVLINLIRCGLQYVMDKNHVKIKVNPADFQYMTRFESEIISSADGLQELDFEKDDRIARGDVIIETHFGNVDCRFGSRMEELEKRFAEILAEKELKAPSDGENL